MPLGAILAAASDVGEDVGIALLYPEERERARTVGFVDEIARRLRNLEPAIGMAFAISPRAAREVVREVKNFLAGLA